MLDPDSCWQAVCNRDGQFDGQFVFAVHSTGIYCRPRCPARRPLRRNVSFQRSPAEAERAAFRPCGRCSPQGLSPAEQLDQLVSAACRLLDNSDKPLSLTQLAARIGLSASHLARAFKVRTGLTPQALSPAQRRKQGAGERLRYSIAPCPLGHLLLASSAKGICALLFGDDPAALLDELQQRFAAAELQEDDAGQGDSLRQVLAQISEPQRAAQLPLDIRGTAFQQQVWRALQQIPIGQTRNYAELAAQLGSHPRAVARACASNPLGLLVPCHRVIASNGGLSGYRWGLERKAALLKSEADTQA